MKGLFTWLARLAGAAGLAVTLSACPGPVAPAFTLPDKLEAGTTVTLRLDTPCSAPVWVAPGSLDQQRDGSAIWTVPAATLQEQDLEVTGTCQGLSVTRHVKVPPAKPVVTVTAETDRLVGGWHTTLRASATLGCLGFTWQAQLGSVAPAEGAEVTYYAPPAAAEPLTDTVTATCANGSGSVRLTIPREPGSLVITSDTFLTFPFTITGPGGYHREGSYESWYVEPTLTLAELEDGDYTVEIGRAHGWDGWYLPDAPSYVATVRGATKATVSVHFTRVPDGVLTADRTSVKGGQPILLTAAFANGCVDAPTFTDSAKLGSFETIDGVTRWTPAPNYYAGEILATLTASCGGESHDLRVTVLSTIPVVTVTADATSVLSGETVNLSATASDGCTDLHWAGPGSFSTTSGPSTVWTAPSGAAYQASAKVLASCGSGLGAATVNVLKAPGRLVIYVAAPAGVTLSPEVTVKGSDGSQRTVTAPATLELPDGLDVTVTGQNATGDDGQAYRAYPVSGSARLITGLDSSVTLTYVVVPVVKVTAGFIGTVRNGQVYLYGNDNVYLQASVTGQCYTEHRWTLPTGATNAFSSGAYSMSFNTPPAAATEQTYTASFTCDGVSAAYDFRVLSSADRGSLRVSALGLPAGVAPSFSVSGPSGLSGPYTTGVSLSTVSGEYHVLPEDVPGYVPDTYDHTVTATGGNAVSVTVHYSPAP
ncbi:MAG TPA: hypothetical protein VHN99_07290 [Deinococcales bacterium]|nr:hypothetical protein [Deinococcales bacterium]